MPHQVGSTAANLDNAGGWESTPSASRRLQTPNPLRNINLASFIFQDPSACCVITDILFWQAHLPAWDRCNRLPLLPILLGLAVGLWTHCAAVARVQQPSIGAWLACTDSAELVLLLLILLGACRTAESTCECGGIRGSC